MKEDGNAHWIAPNYGGTNSSGFTGLPGGLRDNSSKNFQAMGSYGYFWSFTQEGNWVNYRYLINSDKKVGSDWLSTVNGESSTGGSFRCVQD